MKPVSVSQARRIAEATGARAVIVLAFDADGMVAGASYGDTRATCASVAKTLDALIDRTLGLSVPMPEVDRG